MLGLVIGVFSLSSIWASFCVGVKKDWKNRDALLFNLCTFYKLLFLYFFINIKIYSYPKYNS